MAVTAEYRLTSQLASMDPPFEIGPDVTDADSLLAAFAAGCDTRGRYYAAPGLLHRLFWWVDVSNADVGMWRDELVQRGDLKIAPLARDPYTGTPVMVATIQRKHRFPRFAVRPPIPDPVRQFVYARDGHKCLHCGTGESLSLDHVYPYSLGGSDDPSNLQTLCRPCNSSKGAKV